MQMQLQFRADCCVSRWSRHGHLCRRRQRSLFRLQTRRAPYACHLCPTKKTPVRRTKAHQSFSNASLRPITCLPSIPIPRRRTLQHGPQAGKVSETPGEDNWRTGKEEKSEEESAAGDEEDVKTALKALKWYKSTVSPILPRSCRFLPTCSEYSMQAYKEFGNAKGTILTAWRLMRCNPLNWKVQYQGKYDPPKWPPVGFEWLTKQ